MRGPFNQWGFDKGVDSVMTKNNKGQWELVLMLPFSTYPKGSHHQQRSVNLPMLLTPLLTWLSVMNRHHSREGNLDSPSMVLRNFWKRTRHRIHGHGMPFLW